MSDKHYMIMVGHYTVFADKIDGFGPIVDDLSSTVGGKRFNVYLGNGTELTIRGSEKIVKDELESLLNHLMNQQDELPEDHPQGQSG